MPVRRPFINLTKSIFSTREEVDAEAGSWCQPPPTPLGSKLPAQRADEFNPAGRARRPLSPSPLQHPPQLLILRLNLNRSSQVAVIAHFIVKAHDVVEAVGGPARKYIEEA
jgi:hypothetical protein